MHLKEVIDEKSKKKFLQVVNLIYKNDPNYVRPLDIELESTFSPVLNPFFSHGEATRWILINNGQTIGRIAAFINYEKSGEFEIPTGGLGFFECIDDKKAAFTLLNIGVNWLKAKGMQAINAPINFGENNNNWGLLVDGFTQPAYGMSYNPPYYKKFFEEYGFETQYEQYTNHFDINRPLPERFRKIVDRVFSNESYSFRHFEKHRMDDFVNDFVEIYNKAWAYHENFSKISHEYVRKTLNEMDPVLVPEMIWFAYVEDQPAGFIISVPDINQIIKKFNGKMHLLNKFRFLWLKRRKVIDRLRVIIMGIVPEHQKGGLESGLIVKSFDEVKKLKQYNEAELSWVGSFNPAMIALHKASGAVFGKKHITYRKVLEERGERGKV